MSVDELVVMLDDALDVLWVVESVACIMKKERMVRISQHQIRIKEEEKTSYLLCRLTRWSLDWLRGRLF